MDTYRGKVVKIRQEDGSVTISIEGGPCNGMQILGSATARELTKPGVTLAEGNKITVGVKHGRLVSIKKN